MSRARENYTPIVGFAREPAAEVRRWIGRLFLLLVIILLGFILLTRVINPREDEPAITNETELPAPV